ncbi:MAG TPA: M28 family peptidase [Bacteroidota bacterium]|nr:M28 family peptidase [Bacteroidota bacterium]
MKILQHFLIICLLMIVGCSHEIQQYSSPEITSGEILQHIKYLSSDELRGRKTGEEGNRKAAEYIAEQFRSYGLTALGENGSYFQPFPFLKDVEIGDNNSFAVTVNSTHRAYERGTDFLPLKISDDTTLTAPLVFAGYGISSTSDTLKYDDYANIDVHGKIVVVLRYSPDGSGTNRFLNQMSITAKTIVAREKGAAGIIFVSSPPGTDGNALKSFVSPASTSFGIATVVFSWSDLSDLFKTAGKDLKEIQSSIDSTKNPASFDLTGVTASLQTQITKHYSQSANIVGFLEGIDPLLKNEILVVGAHMDHLGMGGEGSLAPDTVAIHHGADDNASGTAGLLEAAQYLAHERGTLKRSILFLSFSGEELGLLGSDYYVNHPLLPLERTIAMINMDMIGRMKDSILVIEGMGTSPQWEPMVKKENKDSLDIRLKPDGYGPSDHSSFYSKNIPVIFFFTNLHSDYHRPSDTWEKINYVGETKVVNYVVRVAEDITNEEPKPTFTKVVASTPMSTGGDRQGVRVSLGVIPDFAETSAGLKITGTRAGSAAEKAGLKGDDIIIKFGGKDVKNIYDFTYLLEQFKPGDLVEIVVKRGTETVKLNATLEARK